MSYDPIEMCRLLVGLGDQVQIRAADDRGPTTPLMIEIETAVAVPVTCPGCGSLAAVKDRSFQTVYLEGGGHVH